MRAARACPIASREGCIQITSELSIRSPRRLGQPHQFLQLRWNSMGPSQPTHRPVQECGRIEDLDHVLHDDATFGAR